MSIPIIGGDAMTGYPLSPEDPDYECEHCGKGLWKRDRGQTWEWHDRTPWMRSVPVCYQCDNPADREG